ncbi:Microsomal glutathione S-transferase 3, partial [Leucoagaricus sp. SymC.cos]
SYHYVVASLSLPALICWWQVMVVLKWRRRAKVVYPQLYADKAQVDANKDAHIFNCAQRAHQNTLEGLPLIVLSTAITGLEYPLIAAGICTFWSLARIPYTLGYITGDPERVRLKQPREANRTQSACFPSENTVRRSTRLWEQPQ